jgi:hypothetical protein
MKITLDVKDYEQLIDNLQTIAKKSHEDHENENTEYHNKLAKECLKLLGECEP